MMQAYVVVEGVSGAKLLNRLLPSHIAQSVEVVQEADAYSAQSLAISLLAVKQKPVALVLDADTSHPLRVKEREDFLRVLFLRVAPRVRFRIFLAVPTFEDMLLNDLALLKPSPEHIFAQPHKVEMGNGEAAAPTRLLDIDQLSQEQTAALQQNALIRELITFLTLGVAGTNGSSRHNGQTGDVAQSEKPA